jgi:hypothetical protein
MKPLIWLSALACSIASVTAQAATAVFEDDFNTFNYVLTEYMTAGYITNVGHHNDGGERSLRYAYERNGANPTQIRMQALNLTFVYDPTASGTITSIDASIMQTHTLYANNAPLNLSNLQNRLRLLAEQNGVLYEAVYDAPGPMGSYGVYSTSAKTGFLASDFLRFDPAIPNGVRTLTGLDFGGSAITFGFEMTPVGVIYSNGNPYDGNSKWTSNFDNFTVAVNHDTLLAGVPEPAQWALLIGGFGMAGAASRRRRRKNFAAA